MAIIFTLEKEQLNQSLIKKINRDSEKEWAFLIYSQFGFTSVEEVIAYAKDKPNWFNNFYWSTETEAFFLAYFLKLYPMRLHKEIKRQYSEVSLAIAPNNEPLEGASK